MLEGSLIEESLRRIFPNELKQFEGVPKVDSIKVKVFLVGQGWHPLTLYFQIAEGLLEVSHLCDEVRMSLV